MSSERAAQATKVAEGIIARCLKRERINNPINRKAVKYVCFHRPDFVQVEPELVAYPENKLADYTKAHMTLTGKNCREDFQRLLVEYLLRPTEPESWSKGEPLPD